MIFWLIPILIALALDVVAYLLAPKPKEAKPDSMQQLEDPTAEAGITRPWLFGTMTVLSPNVAWYGDKSMNSYMVAA